MPRKTSEPQSPLAECILDLDLDLSLLGPDPSLRPATQNICPGYTPHAALAHSIPPSSLISQPQPQHQPEDTQRHTPQHDPFRRREHPNHLVMAWPQLESSLVHCMSHRVALPTLN